MSHRGGSNFLGIRPRISIWIPSASLLKLKSETLYAYNNLNEKEYKAEYLRDQINNRQWLVQIKKYFCFAAEGKVERVCLEYF